MSKVGSLRKLPVGEYSRRMTSGARTSKRASPSVTVAWVAAVPLAMLMLLERFTGEVSVVAVCALAVPAAAATMRIAAAAVMAALGQGRRLVGAGRWRHDLVGAGNMAGSSYR